MDTLLLIKGVKKIKTFLRSLNFIIANRTLFYNYNATTSQNTSVGFSKKYVIKVENFVLNKKLNDIDEEAAIIKYLNEKNCVSCPKLLKQGRLPNGKKYIILERIKCHSKTPLADLAFAIIEQKNLGVLHGDINFNNAIFNGIYTVLIDYDQARLLPEIVEMSNIEYLDFIANDVQSKWGNYLYNEFKYEDVKEFKDNFLPFFKGDAFDLGTTTLLKTQVTTISDTGFYHSINSDKLHIQGMRDIDSRSPIMDKIEFEPNEKVLDFGCNAGLLSHYLSRRNCQVSGCDMDKNIITAAKMLSNILGESVKFFKCDIDYEKFEENYDTICLFSVIHHTKNMAKNAKFIASKCNRIIIECRLNEIGQKPTKNGWIYTSKWDFKTEDELTTYLEKLFPNFKYEQTWGQGDRNRFIITLLKDKTI